MAAGEIDPNERIGGFALPKVQRALGLVGLLDDRDDIKTVADTLQCPRGQAHGVLEALERKGFVKPTAKKNQWEKTREGTIFAWQWKAPRQLTPAIEREHPTGQGNQGFESVCCSIWRSDPDDTVMFEEGVADATCWVDYEGDRLVELSVTQPSDPESPFEGGTIECSIYLSPAEARKLISGMQEAIAAAEKEIALRAKADARRAERAAKAKPKPVKASKGTTKRRPTESGSQKVDTETPPTKAPKLLSKPVDKEAEARRAKQAALRATLAELRGPPTPAS